MKKHTLTLTIPEQSVFELREEVQPGCEIIVINQHNNRLSSIQGVFEYTCKTTGKITLGCYMGEKTQCVNHLERDGDLCYISVVSFGGGYYPLERKICTYNGESKDIAIITFDNVEEFFKYYSGVKKHNLSIIRASKKAS
jgi:hypothetical protein